MLKAEGTGMKAENGKLKTEIAPTTRMDSVETGGRGFVEAGAEPFITKEEVACLMRKPVRTIEE